MTHRSHDATGISIITDIVGVVADALTKLADAIGHSVRFSGQGYDAIKVRRLQPRLREISVGLVDLGMKQSVITDDLRGFVTALETQGATMACTVFVLEELGSTTP
jgi:hypothetical protein